MTPDAAHIARGRVVRLNAITRGMVQADRNTLFVFGDNMTRSGFGGQAAAMRGEPNTIGVPTKWAPDRRSSSYFDDADAEVLEVRMAILMAFEEMRVAISKGRNVVIPANGLGTGLAELPTRAPRIHRAIEARITALEAWANDGR